MTSIDKRLARIEKTLLRNTLSLEEHMRRSQANEEALNLLKQELKPIQSHIYRVDGALKLIGLIGVLVGIGIGIFKTFSGR